MLCLDMVGFRKNVSTPISWGPDRVAVVPRSREAGDTMGWCVQRNARRWELCRAEGIWLQMRARGVARCTTSAVRAGVVLGQVDQWRGRLEQMERALTHALAMFRATGDRRGE